MRKTGRGTTNLTENLQQTVAKQRQAHQTAMETELEMLTNALKASSSAALAGLENDIKSQTSRLQNELKRRVAAMDGELTEIRDRPRRMILISALIAATTSAIFWTGPMLWTRWTLSGVQIATDPSGTYLILPPNAETGWTCRGKPCVKLED